MKISKKIISVILTVVFVFGICPVAFAGTVGTTYYVNSVTGNDANNGKSVTSAWKTLAKVSATSFQEGDKILLNAGGIFTDTFVAKGDGTAENPITVSSYGDIKENGKPMIVISGEKTAVTVHNVSGWVFENLDISAPDGRGIIVTADGCIMKDITVQNVDLHNIWNHITENGAGGNACVYIAANGLDTRIENFSLIDVTMKDSAYGIHMGGNTIEFSPENYISPEKSYSQNMLFENVDMYNIDYDGMAICSVNHLFIHNCALINTSLRTDYYTAPLWMHHANDVVVDHCEVAGATNYKDGMTVDFDGWTTNSTYQYVYSHDNIRFMQNCVYDNTTKNDNCTVRYCLSVNDNKEPNNINLLSSSYYPAEDGPKYMDHFKFYNNTVVNSSEFRLQNLRNSVIANNIFVGDLSMRFLTTGKGDEGINTYTGVFTNNCFYGCGIPSVAKNSVNENPCFVGSDYDDFNSFKLSENSPLLGKGTVAEKDMGTEDIYGNTLTDTHNIGCYEGIGESGSATENDDIASVVDIFTRIIGYLYNAILVISFLF